MGRKKVYDLWVSLRLKNQGFTTGMGKARAMTAAAKKEMTGLTSAAKAAKGAMLGFGSLIVGGGFVGALTKGSKEFLSWETGLARVGTLMGAGQDSFAMYGTAVNNMSIQFGMGMNVVTEALYQTISASVDAGDATEFLGVAGKTAVGGLTDMATAVDGLTSVMNAYGLATSEAAHIGDVFAIAQKRGKTTIGEISAQIGLVTPIASALGVPIEELAAGLATATKQGIGTASATAALRQVLVAIVAPPIRARKKLEELGISWGEQTLKARGLAGSLKYLSDSLDGDKESMSRILGSVEALNISLALTSERGMKDMNDITLEMQTSVGELDKAFAKMSATTEMKLRRMKESFNVAFAVIGEGFFDGIGLKAGNTENVITSFAEEAGRSLREFFHDFDYYKEQAQDLLNIFLLYQGGKIGVAAFRGLAAASVANLGTAALNGTAASSSYNALTNTRTTTPGTVGAGSMAKWGGRAFMGVAALMIAAEVVELYGDRVEQNEAEGLRHQFGGRAVAGMIGTEKASSDYFRSSAAKALEVQRRDFIRTQMERTSFGRFSSRGLMEMGDAGYSQVVEALLGGEDIGEMTGPQHDWMLEMRERLAKYDERQQENHATLIQTVTSQWRDAMTVQRADEYDRFDSLMREFHYLDAEGKSQITVDIALEHRLKDASKKKLDHSGSVRARIERGEGEARVVNPRYRMTLAREGYGATIASPMEDRAIDATILDAKS